MHTGRKLFALTGILGLVAGMLMLAKPDGSLVNMQLAWLDKTPVSNYLIPGIVLGFGYGVIPLVLNSSRLFSRRRVLLYCFLAVDWIILEAVLFDLFHWLHALFVFMLVIVIFSMLQNKNSL